MQGPCPAGSSSRRRIARASRRWCRRWGSVGPPVRWDAVSADGTLVSRRCGLHGARGAHVARVADQAADEAGVAVVPFAAGGRRRRRRGTLVPRGTLGAVRCTS
eukprot:scaffold1070_cov245-Pinguiococcus_pyrenoidosus.AAC.3